jgi:hypothetical protein
MQMVQHWAKRKVQHWAKQMVQHSARQMVQHSALTSVVAMALRSEMTRDRNSGLQMGFYLETTTGRYWEHAWDRYSGQMTARHLVHLMERRRMAESLGPQRVAW